MAIIEELGVGVSICIDGRPAVEYDDPNPTVNDEDEYFVYSTYVESVDGAEYALTYTCLPDQRWLYNNPKNRLTFRVYIDGQERCAHSANRNLILYNDGKLVVEGAEAFRGHGQLMALSKFRFNAITTGMCLPYTAQLLFEAKISNLLGSVEDADDQAIEKDKKRAETLGLIKVEVWREYQRGNSSDLSSDADDELDVNDSELLIAEQALKGKAISHGTS